MVRLHIKQGDENLFLYETKLEYLVEEVIESLIEIHNGRLKIKRLCTEIELLSEHGISKPLEMHGLLEEQIKELNFNDDYEQKCEPSGGFEENKDPCGRRNGRRPTQDMRVILEKTMAEAKGIISNEQVASGGCLTREHIQDAVAVLRGGVEVVYPAALPPHDPVRCEFDDDRERLPADAADATGVLHPVMTQLWFAGKQLENGKKLSHYFGSNEKTKVVVKLQKRGSGAPAREPLLNEKQRKEFMMAEFKRREALKKLDEDEDHSYLNSAWADNYHLKKSCLGLKNVSWKPH